MTRRRAVVRFIEHTPPQPGSVGKAEVEITIARPGSHPPVRVVTRAESGVGGQKVTIREGQQSPWEGALLWAGLRWSAGEGPPDLTLDWEIGDGARLNHAVVDIRRLATDRDAQWAVRAFMGVLPRLGPPSGGGLTRGDIVERVREYAGEPTQENIADSLRCSVRHLQTVAAGWPAVLQEAGRA